MGITINCIFNEDGPWCTNKLIKKSLLGLGSRCCLIYPPRNRGVCDLRRTHPEPSIVSPPPPPKKTHKKENADV